MLERAPVTHFRLKKKKKTKHAYKCRSVNSEMFCPLEGISCFVFILERIKAERPLEHVYMAVCPLKQGCCEAERGVLLAGQSPSLYAFFVVGFSLERLIL